MAMALAIPDWWIHEFVLLVEDETDIEYGIRYVQAVRHMKLSLEFFGNTLADRLSVRPIAFCCLT